MAHGKELARVAPGPLLAIDRCDRCRAQAYVEVEVPVFVEVIRAYGPPEPIRAVEKRVPLLFCAHHFREHETALGQQGATIRRDERHRLQPRSTQGDVY